MIFIFLGIGFQSSFFTWKKGTGPNLILEHLNRVLASNSWKQLFPKIVLWHLPCIKSDHCPLLLEFNIHTGTHSRN